MTEIVHCKLMQEALDKGYILHDTEDIDNKGFVDLYMIHSGIEGKPALLIKFCPYCGAKISLLCTDKSRCSPDIDDQKRLAAQDFDLLTEQLEQMEREARGEGPRIDAPEER